MDYEYAEDYEVCPSCGDLAILVESSGWCTGCTADHTSANNLCIDCGTSIPTNHQRKLCWNCKEERWLKKYGDVIEYLMLTGMSFNKAREMVADAVRPVCVVCSGPIKGGTPGESLFCSATEKCKQARNKYRRLLNGGMQPHRAIYQVMR